MDSAVWTTSPSSEASTPPPRTWLSFVASFAAKLMPTIPPSCARITTNAPRSTHITMRLARRCSSSARLASAIFAPARFSEFCTIVCM